MYTVRKSAHENQDQIDLNYSSIHFSSDRGIKFGCMKFSALQTTEQANPEALWDALENTQEHSRHDLDNA